MPGELQWHDEALAQLFFDPTGPVGLDIRKRIVRVEQVGIRSVQQPGTGRLYGKHRASAPGRPPATDTGRLANDLRSEVHVDAHGIVGTFGGSVDYLEPLELGTRNMEARPVLRPALRAALD